MLQLVQLSHVLGELLLLSGQKLVLAESCTGGMVAMSVTAVPGSSKWFDRGFVTYSNASKTALLSVPDEMINQWGAVSPEVALAMAKGAMVASDAQVSGAITGIAGPDGGSAGKPVGMVCFGFGLRNMTTKEETFVTETCYFKGDRQQIRVQASAYVLQRLLELIRSQH